MDVEVFIPTLLQNPVTCLTNYYLIYDSSHMLMPLLVSDLENFRCLTFVALCMAAARRSDKNRGRCYVKPCYLTINSDLPPRMMCVVQLVSTVNCCLWQVQGSSRGGAPRMWHCDNVRWSCRGADREWTNSPGVSPHHSDISGQPHYQTLLTHSSSWISHTEYNDRNVTSQWQRETVSITTG